MMAHAPGSNAALTAEALGVARQGRRVFESLDFALRAGEVTAVMGPNGAGKSTLIDCLSGFLSPQAGTVRLVGRPLSTWPLPELCRLRSVMSQSSAIAAPFTVEELLRLGIPRACRRSHRDVERHVQLAAERADVAGLRQRRANRLSGGELQRVHFARCLLQMGLVDDGEVGVVMLDEPVSHQDLGHQEQILEVCRQLAASGHIVLVVLHDVNLVARWSDELLLLGEGRIVDRGAVTTVLGSQCFAEVFGVELTTITDARGRSAWHVKRCIP